MTPRPPAWTIAWDAIEASLAEVAPVAQLAATPQDPGFHAEGDVWTHTRMVVEALVADDDWRGLPAVERAIVFTAALAHDLGKPSTTRLDGGRLIARGHSARGEKLVREWLWRRGAPFDEREAICRLVRSHQVPFFAIDRDDAAHGAALRSLSLRNDHLVLVALADARGRACADPRDQQRIVDQTLLYRELCRDLGVLDRARAFPDDHTRVVWRETAGRRPADVPAFDDTTCDVWITSGLPASGKDTWLAAHHPELPVVSLDALREALAIDPADDQGTIVHAARDAAREHLRARRSFAWNATNLSDRVRGQAIQLARDYGARVHLVYCEAPPDVLAARNRARRDPVPAGAMARMLERWSVPTADEAHTVTYVVS